MSKRRVVLGLLAVLAVVVAAIGGFVLYAQTERLCPAADLDVTHAGEWTLGAPMPTARSEIAAAALDGKIYVVGGFVLSPEVTTDALEAYDIDADSWETLAPAPEAVHHPGLAAYDGKLYLAGGYTGVDFTATDHAWVYDPAEDAWSPVASLPQANGAHVLVTIGDTIFLVGGAPGGTILWAYDPAADAWANDLAPMPTAREHLGAAAIDGKLYVAGGRQSSNLRALEVYDPETNTWEALPDMPTARGGFSVAGIDGLLYAGGGEDFVDGGCTFNRAEVYDPETVSWARLPDMPSPRHGITSVSADGRWFVIGGATGAGGQTFVTASDEIAIFTPATG